ncbi:Rmf/CrpP fold protein [Streptomyces sp. NPDC006743]|uniref:Rmf/CrpP fold protein n=1 Tax=Streptomyces sp. NPDC006743 TaxID=3154480 RepID=UPI003454B839
MGTREDITRAVIQGAEAGRRGDDVRTCPHPSDSLLRTAWIKGYARARPVADNE